MKYSTFPRQQSGNTGLKAASCDWWSLCCPI